MSNPDLECYSEEELVKKYSKAVETIWFLQEKINSIEPDYDMLNKAYEEVSYQLSDENCLVSCVYFGALAPFARVDSPTLTDFSPTIITKEHQPGLVLLGI